MDATNDNLKVQEIVDALNKTYFVHNGKMYRHDQKDILGFFEIANVILAKPKTNYDI